MADWRSIYRVHPSSQVFPSLGDDLDKLINDIQEHGLKQPIKLWRHADGTTWLVDGRSRADALQRLGWNIADHAEFITCSASELPSLIISLNVHRRHLEPSDRVKLAYAAIQAGNGFAPAGPVRGKRQGIVSTVASAARVSRPTAYNVIREIAPGVVPTAKAVHRRIQAALDHQEQLPPDPPRHKSKHNGRSRTLERRVADHVGIAVATVKRHIRTQPIASPDEAQGNGHVKHDGDEVAYLRRALRALEKVDGTSLREGVGASLLRRIQRAVARITTEYATGEVTLGIPGIPAGLCENLSETRKAEGSSLRTLTPAP